MPKETVVSFLNDTVLRPAPQSGIFDDRPGNLAVLPDVFAGIFRYGHE